MSDTKAVTSTTQFINCSGTGITPMEVCKMREPNGISNGHPEIIIAGLMIADILVKPFRELPSEGDVVEVESIEMHPGGDGLNTALAMAALGHRVKMVGCIGDDKFGELILDALTLYGVDASQVRKLTNVRTSACIALVTETGDRCFLFQPGADQLLTASMVMPALESNAKVFHIGSLFGLSALTDEAGSLFARARELGMATTFDVTWDRQGRWLNAIRDALAHTSVVMPSELEARMLTNCNEPMQMARELLSMGPDAVVLKLGERGCLWMNKCDCGIVPARRIDVIDSTGAGDAFVAGFLSAMLDGLPIQKCCERGVAVASLCIAGIGADAAARKLRAEPQLAVRLRELAY
ncbi:MAG TPA: sugar kinase [Armatimonadetes bacterium]|nr:sugar kinase [Armatimonadota bacterium]